MKDRIFKILLITVIIMLFSTTIYAATPRITLTVDHNTASIDDSITAQVSVEGKAFVSQPILMGIYDFRVRTAGSSSQMQIINGQMTSSKVFHYILTPKKMGIFTIGPAVTEIGGTEYKSQTVTVNITGERIEPAEERFAYMTAKVSNSNPYVGEQIIYTAQFYTKVAIQNTQLGLPEFHGFWKEQLGEVRNTQKVINGQLWHVSTIQFALFPNEPGNIAIDKASLTADIVIATRRPSSFFSNPFFDSFHNMERRIFRSKALGINVKPLPTEGRPANFAGLVGNFTISETITKTELEAGDSTTLTVTVKGNGNLSKLPSPKITNTQDFKVYDDEPTLKTVPSSNGLKEIKIFKKAIVPLRPGKQTIPAFTFPYFDPKKGEYVLSSTNAFTLNVSPSSSPEKVIVSSGDGRGFLKQELEVLGEDLMPVIKDVETLDVDILTKSKLLLYVIFAAIPLMGFFIALLLYFRLQKIRSDSGYIRRGKAYRQAHKATGNLKKISENEFYTKTSLLLRDYIGNKLNIDGRALTAADVSRRLEPNGVSEDTCKAITDCLNDCDARLYGGKEYSNDDRDKMITKVTTLIKKLEKEFKK